METTPTSRPWFVLLPLLLLMGLCLVPSFRRMMASEFRLITGSSKAYAWALREQGVKAENLPESDPGEEQKAVKALSAANPQDYSIQLAFSLLSEWSHAENAPDERVKRLDALAGEFPKRATIFAHMLRYETEREVKIRRKAEFDMNVNNVLKEDLKPDPDEQHPPDDLKVRLPEFDRYASAGEKLEPDNAYFSMMRAIGQFASKQDSDAIDSLKSASTKTRFEDYITDELTADWILGSQAFADHSAALRAVIQGGVKSPHLLQLVELGRTAVMIAIEKEARGDYIGGANIRIAMAKCGALMRVNSHTIAGSLAGCDIVYQQIFRPGAAPAIIEDVNFSKAEREQQRLDACFAYLRKNNHAADADWLRSELQAESQVREIQQGVADTALSPYGQQGLRVTSWSMIGCVLLTNILFLILPALLAVPFMRKKKSANSSMVLVLVGSYALLIAIAWQTQWATAMTSMRASFMNWILNNHGHGAQSRLAALTDRVFDPTSIHVVVVGLSVIAPLICFGWIYIVSRKRNIVFVDMIRLSLSETAGILACIIVVLYFVTLTITSRHDTILHNELDQVMVNEGRFLAPMIGRQWPQ